MPQTRLKPCGKVVKAIMVDENDLCTTNLEEECESWLTKAGTSSEYKSSTARTQWANCAFLPEFFVLRYMQQINPFVGSAW